MKLHKKTIISVLPSLLVIVLLATGFVAGRYSITKTFDKYIENTAKVFTFGGFLDHKEQQELIHVYHDEDHVLGKIASFSYAVPNIPAPFVGNAPMPGRHGNASINSEQFRYEKEIGLPKPDNTFRIFITGGSTAYGSGASSQDRTIAGYLEKMLTKELSPVTQLNYEVVTAANPAWASTHERIFIENKLSELDPDMIISFSGNNDVHWGFLGRNVLWFRSYADELFLDLIKQVYHLTDQPVIPEITQIVPEKVAPSLVAKRLSKNVKLSSFALSLEGTDYVFVLQPTLAVTGKQLTTREAAKVNKESQEYFKQCYTQIEEALGAFAADNYHYVSLTNVFDTLGNQEDIFIDSYHFGDKGNEIVAANILLHIKDILRR